MNRQKQNPFESSFSKVHLQKQTLTIKNVGLKHQLTLAKDELQAIIIKCKQLSRVKQNLYCLLERTRLEKNQEKVLQEQVHRQTDLKEEIKKQKDMIAHKDGQLKTLKEEYETYLKKKDKVLSELDLIAQKIAETEKQFQSQVTQLKETKQINFDLQKLRRVLQQQKDNTIQLHTNQKVNHVQFQKQYESIIERLLNDEINLKKVIILSKRKCAIITILNLFESKQKSYFRQFWFVREFILSGERSLKCIDNLAKIANTNGKYNMRYFLSLWMKRSFDIQKITSITQSVIVLATENRIKFKTFSLMESVCNAQQLKLLKQYDKIKYIYQLRLKYSRKDVHVALNGWWNKITLAKKKKSVIMRLGKLLNNKMKNKAMICWRNYYMNTLQKQQQLSNKVQLEDLRKLSYAFTRVEELKFEEQEQKMRLYFDRHQLLTHAKTQINYHRRINKILEVMANHRQKNQLRSALYILHSKCLSQRAKQTDHQYKIVKKQGEKTNKQFKTTLTTKSQLRKDLLVSFLGRYLDGKEMKYERKLMCILTKWRRNFSPITTVVKGALRKHKLTALTSLVNHALVKKYHISPAEIESLRNKKQELEDKQKYQIEGLQSLKKKHRLIAVLRINQFMDAKISQHKSVLFNITSKIQLSHIKSRSLQKSLRIVQLNFLRKGLQILKTCNSEAIVNENLEKKLNHYFSRRQRVVKKSILSEWKQRVARLIKGFNLVSGIKRQDSYSNIRQSFYSIKQFCFLKQESELSKKNKQLERSILSQKTVCSQIEKEKYQIQDHAKKCLKQFFTTFNQRLNKKLRKEQNQQLKSRILLWQSVTHSQRNREAKLSIMLRKIEGSSKQYGFFCLLKASVKSISIEYKDKISTIHKKDKANELKIAKGDQIFGEQLRKQKESNDSILKQLQSKQKRFNSLLLGHQKIYKDIEKRHLQKICWFGWKRIVDVKNKILKIQKVCHLNQRRRSFSLLKLVGQLNCDQNRKIKFSSKIIQISNFLAEKIFYNKWKQITHKSTISNLTNQQQEMTSLILSKSLLQEATKQSHGSFIHSSKLRNLKMNTFAAWKLLASSQKLINSKQSYISYQRRQSLCKSTFRTFEKSVSLKNKINNLSQILSKSAKVQQQKCLLHFNKNIKCIKKLFRFLVSKVHNSNISNLVYSFTRIERAAQYRFLAYDYQKKKASFRLMKSMITQSGLNKQRSLFSFLEYETKTHHHLPNIIVQLQKTILQSSFYKLRQAAYDDQKLIQKQAQSIMQTQKYLINREIREMSCQRINGEELKEYLYTRAEQDSLVMKQVVSRLKLYGSKKILLKCWNSWTEKVKTKKAAILHLQSIVNFQIPQIKYWNRWKLRKCNKQESDINLSRKDLISKHYQVRKLAATYQQELLEMRSGLAELKFLNNTQEHKLIITSKIALNRLSKCFNKGLSNVLSTWKCKAKKTIDKSKKYDLLTQQIENLISKRGAIMNKLAEVNASNSSLRQNCKQGGVQAERLKDLLLQKENLSICLADKKYNIKILLQDNLKIKQKLKQAQDQAVRLVNEFKPLMDRTNYQ